MRPANSAIASAPRTADSSSEFVASERRLSGSAAARLAFASCTPSVKRLALNHAREVR
jgi:hypothetical protein